MSSVGQQTFWIVASVLLLWNERMQHHARLLTLSSIGAALPYPEWRTVTDVWCLISGELKCVTVHWPMHGDALTAQPNFLWPRRRHQGISPCLLFLFGCCCLWVASCFFLNLCFCGNKVVLGLSCMVKPLCCFCNFWLDSWNWNALQVGETPLHVAAKKGHREVVELLLDSFHRFNNVAAIASIDEPNEVRPFLCLAIQLVSLNASPLFLDISANVSGLSHALIGVYIHVCRCGYIVSWCLSSPVQILCMHFQDGLPPLWVAVKDRRANIVEVLLRFGADPNKGFEVSVTLVHLPSFLAAEWCGEGVRLGLQMFVCILSRLVCPSVALGANPLLAACENCDIIVFLRVSQYRCIFCCPNRSYTLLL